MVILGNSAKAASKQKKEHFYSAVYCFCEKSSMYRGQFWKWENIENIYPAPMSETARRGGLLDFGSGGSLDLGSGASD
jgi:hypothetical protein